jgi:hypothetical protein
MDWPRASNRPGSKFNVIAVDVLSNWGVLYQVRYSSGVLSATPSSPYDERLRILVCGIVEKLAPDLVAQDESRNERLGRLE